MVLNGSVLISAGTRPELIKLAPIFEQLKERDISFTFVWSGQHYDYELSKIFIKELHIPEPDFDLGVGSGSHATQTAKTIVGIEEATSKNKPLFTLALGDTNGVVATALASTKIGVPFLHIESGLRSWDETMPEEINRVVADHVAQALFTPSALATMNVLNEGLSQTRIFNVGNTVIDVLFKNLKLAEKKANELIRQHDLDVKEYFMVTFHRQENVETPDRLKSIIKALIKLANDTKIIIPFHPRAKNKLVEQSLYEQLRDNKNMVLLEPLGYFDFLGLLKEAKAVLTDSGGVQEEAFTLGIPTVTLRYNTERPETVLLGCNVLAGADESRIVNYAHKMAELRNSIQSRLKDAPNPYGDGHAGERIVDVFEKIFDEGIALRSPDLRAKPLVAYNLKQISELSASDEVLGLFDDKGNATNERSKAKYAIVRSARKSA